MSLKLSVKPPRAKTQVAIFVAIFSLLAYPMYAVVANHVANAVEADNKAALAKPEVFGHNSKPIDVKSCTVKTIIYTIDDQDYSINCANFNGEYSKTVDELGLSDGTHTIDLRFVLPDDSNQHLDDALHTFPGTFLVDTTAPQISWQLQPNAIYTKDSSFAVRPITNEVGTTKSIYFDSVSPSNLIWTLTSDHKNFDTSDKSNEALWNSLPNGVHTFVAVFTDAAGNTTTSTSEPFVIDRQAPTVKVNLNRKSYVQSGSVVNSKQNPEIEASDNNLDKVVVYKNDKATHTWTAVGSSSRRANISFLGNGDYVIRAYDKAGNVSSDFNLTIDNTAPTIENITIERAITNQNQITIKGTVTDSNLKDYNLRVYKADKSGQVSPGIYYTGTTSVTNGVLGTLDVSSLKDGQYWVRIWADDLAGNRTGIASQIFVPFTVDRTAPTGTFTYSNNSAPTKGNVIAYLTTSEPVTISPTSLHGWEATDPTGLRFKHKFTNNGSFDAVITDAAGNTSTLTADVSWIDRTAPTIKVKDGYVGNLDSKIFSNVSFALSDAGNGKVDKYVINGYTSDFNNNKHSDANFQNIKSHLVEGKNTLVLYDEAGNSTEYDFTYDTTSPVISWNNPKTTISGEYTFNISQVETNPNRMYVEYDQLVDGKWQKNTGNWYYGTNSAALAVDTTSWADGTYQLKVSSDDAAWNHGAYAKMFYVNNVTKSVLQDPFKSFKTLFSDSNSTFGFSDHSVEWGEYTDSNALWHGAANTEWYVVYESANGWTTTNGQIPGKTVVYVDKFTTGQAIPKADPIRDLKMLPGQSESFWVHLVPVTDGFNPEVNEPYPADAAYTRAWQKVTLSVAKSATGGDDSDSNSSNGDNTSNSQNGQDNNQGGNENENQLNVSNATAALLPAVTSTINRFAATTTTPFYYIATGATTNNGTDIATITNGDSGSTNGSVLGKSTTKSSDDKDGSVLADESNKKGWSVINLALTGLTALLSVIALIGFSKKDDEKHTGARLTTVLVAAAAIVAFFLTEDLSSSMIWFNWWTLLYAALFTAQVIVKPGHQSSDEQ